MVRPYTLTVGQTARLLDVPEGFLPLLSERGLFPCPEEDGAYDVREVNRARSARPWMRLLGVPMCLGELAHVDARLRIPAGRGFTWAGRRYCRLWECLAAGWNASIPDPV
ncbi:hypothetical protein [Bifidobacterium sp. SO1]|uniref:hypothetical protein n=1 Tax=Bifidobacterium sp. SO1 TaxID=2809029 RepID=UPI001BDC53BC|nr:hypothetical protein [Bifidobacterium sp. SO1]MBT1161852.1 hypothetical protein [Bifidobacterium sp. SO1]